VVSRAIASLDAWLERAEEVLQEQRESGISPSLSARERTDYNDATIMVESFATALYGLLRSLSNRPGRWILIAEDAKRPNRFVQFLVYEDGSACAECVSNLYLDPIDQWTRHQEEQLAKLGWDHPVEPRRPNWITHDDCRRNFVH
jgi:hypothetical protein